MDEHEFKFELGDDVQDVISGYKGKVVARTQRLYDSNYYHVVRFRDVRISQVSIPEEKPRVFVEDQLSPVEKGSEKNS